MLSGEMAGVCSDGRAQKNSVYREGHQVLPAWKYTRESVCTADVSWPSLPKKRFLLNQQLNRRDNSFPAGVGAIHHTALSVKAQDTVVGDHGNYNAASLISTQYGQGCACMDRYVQTTVGSVSGLKVTDQTSYVAGQSESIPDDISLADFLTGALSSTSDFLSHGTQDKGSQHVSCLAPKSQSMNVPVNTTVFKPVHSSPISNPQVLVSRGHGVETTNSVQQILQLSPALTHLDCPGVVTSSVDDQMSMDSSVSMSSQNMTHLTRFSNNMSCATACDQLVSQGLFEVQPSSSAASFGSNYSGYVNPVTTPQTTGELTHCGFLCEEVNSLNSSYPHSVTTAGTVSQNFTSFVQQRDIHNSSGVTEIEVGENCLDTQSQGEGTSVLESSLTQANSHITDSGGSPLSDHTTSQPESSELKCQVCCDTAAGFHCGAYVCEACKKFFIRTAKKGQKKLVCLKRKQCIVTKKLRTLCQFCRYQKCLNLGMYKPGEGPGSGAEAEMGVIPCRVCSAPSSGYHFGAITCEGCKGFFRRMIKEREAARYGCVKGGACPVTQSTRNVCKYCRYQKCLQVGMSAEGSRIGRQPNAVKHATLMELQGRRGNACNASNPDLPPFTGNTSDSQPCLPCTSVSNCMKQPLPSSASLPGNLNCGQLINKATCRSDRDYTHVHMSPVQCGLMKTTSKSQSSVDILSEVFTAGRELDRINTRSVEQVELKAEDFQDLNFCWRTMMAQFTKHTHATLNFAKKIPGFRSLKLDDQASLLRTAIYPIIVLCHSKCFDPETRSYNYFNYTDRERNLIFHFIPGFIPLEEHFCGVGDMVTLLNVDEREYDFLCALILLSPDEGEVIEKAKVWEVQENIAASLQEYEEKTYEDGGTRFGVLIARLAEFRMINLQHQQIVASVIKRHPSFQVPQLYSEMFLIS